MNQFLLNELKWIGPNQSCAGPKFFPVKVIFLYDIWRIHIDRKKNQTFAIHSDSKRESKQVLEFLCSLLPKEESKRHSLINAQRNTDGMTALSLASLKGALECVQILIRYIALGFGITIKIRFHYRN